MSELFCQASRGSVIDGLCTGGGRGRQEGKERCVFAAECLEVALLTVSGAGFPAPKQDADPLEGQAAQGGMMAFARGPLLKVEGSRPGGAFGGTGREFMKGLQEELGTSPTTMDDAPSAALLRDGRDARKRLQLAGRLEPLAIGAERGEQPRGEGRAGAGQVAE